MSGAPDGAAAVHALLDDLYDAVVAGDRPRFDGHLAADVTIWESNVPALMRGVPALARYRDERDARNGPPALVSLNACDRLVDVHGDIAVARYRLVARTADDIREFRVTDVLRRAGAGTWHVVHHHAEQRAAEAATSGPDRG